MKLTILTTALFFICTEGLECGIHISKNEKLTATINRCISSNKTLEDLWDMAPMSSESDSSSSEDEEKPLVDGKMSDDFGIRTKRADSNLGIPQEVNETTTDRPQTEEPASETSESCIIQCIFQNLNMTDTVGYPAHDKILENLLKNATTKEITDFLQDTTDECFQEMDKEATMDPCFYSVKLVTCLAERGKSNCADWPVGDLPLH